jgi:hypothetical protein
MLRPNCPAWPREMDPPQEWCDQARGKMLACKQCAWGKGK